MPSTPILDAHVHIWDPARYHIPWLDGITALNRRMWLEQYAEATNGLPVEGFVYLQVEVATPYAIIEARELVDLSREHPVVAAVVPWAPLEYGEQSRTFLDQLVALGPEIKGVRRIVQDEPDPEYCLQPGFVRGNQILGELGLSSDICCNFRQLGPNVELVRQCPETMFILDHLAKPDIRNGTFQPWADQMRELSMLPNCYCKISGAVTEADHQSWSIEDVKPYILHAIDVFGEDRIVFGSDWPVVTQAAAYARWIEALDQLTFDLSESTLRKLWRDNGRRFYRIDTN
ncbi:amidohydrolase family protein [soil metagenome]